MSRVVDETEAGKGRATPSRKNAEAARKQQMKKPVSRKDQAKRERASREVARTRQREALNSGDEKYLPARDRGPVRRLARDFVDRRRNVAEFLLVILAFILVLSVVASRLQQQWAAYAVPIVWVLTIIGTVVDEFALVRGLRKELKTRFPPEETRGTLPYAVLRSSQLRRFRLPKVQIKRGAPLPNRY